MNTATNVSQPARSRPSTRRDQPATVWAPLVDLTDAATRTASHSGTVAITRGFDRDSRRRAKALRQLIEDHGVTAVEVTQAPGSECLLADTEIAAVVNLIGDGVWQPYRLAAKMSAPALTPKSSDRDSVEIHRDVIGIAGQDGAADVALSRVAVLSENAEISELTISRDGEELSISGGQVTVTPREQSLEVRLTGQDFAEHVSTAHEVRVEPLEGPHRLIRDELPVAELNGALTLTARPRGLVVRPV